MAKRRDKGDGGIYQRGDGRWVGVVEGGYVAGKRVRRTVTAATRREILPRFARLKKEMAAGVSPEALTVGEWVTTWINRLEAKGRAPRTVSTYRGYHRTWIDPLLGKRRLADLRPADVSGMLDTMIERGKSERTRQQAYALLHAALETAERERRVLENVASRIERPTVKPHKPEALTPEQGAALMALPWPTDCAARWWVALLAGLRQGEALALRWEDVHLDDGAPWLWVHQVAQPRKGEGMVIKPTTKGNRPRVVALRHEVADALRTHRQDGGVGYVWGGERIVRPERDYALWKDALATAGLPSVTLHSARATAQTWLDQLGVPPQTISDMLGHATLTMTAQYHRATAQTQAAGLAQARVSLEA